MLQTDFMQITDFLSFKTLYTTVVRSPVRYTSHVFPRSRDWHPPLGTRIATELDLTPSLLLYCSRYINTCASPANPLDNVNNMIKSNRHVGTVKDDVVITRTLTFTSPTSIPVPDNHYLSLMCNKPLVINRACKLNVPWLLPRDPGNSRPVTKWKKIKT